jgi:hypothetical protein
MRRDEDDCQRLARIRKEAWKAVEDSYVFGNANSYTHEAMRAVLALDACAAPGRTKPQASESDLRAAIAVGRPN